MQRSSRRTFLKQSAAAAVSFTLSSRSFILGANEAIRVGIVGLNSKGAQHIIDFKAIPGVRVVALCDVDQQILDREVCKFKERNEPVVAYRDIRTMLDDKNIDAIVIATPNHWHSLIGIWACQAGKDVYVEKPVSHNIWEGQKLVEAARTYNRVVQAGMQNRSDVGFCEAVAELKNDALGKILWAHGIWFKDRPPVEEVGRRHAVPAAIDYNLWLGPARKTPLMRKNLHYDWHWFWDTGNGDMGNLGVHQIDDCCFALGLTGYPTRIMTFGGRFVWNDGAETPNTLVSIYDYPGTPVIIETRNLPKEQGMRGAMDHVHGVRDGGNIIQCEHGYFAGGRGGGWFYDYNDRKIKQFVGDGGGTHQANFIDAVRSRRIQELHTEIHEGDVSSALSHIGNISYQIGHEASVADIRNSILPDASVHTIMDRVIDHLHKNGVDLDKTQFTLGPWLQFDEQGQKFAGQFSRTANKLLKRKKYRKPFVIPEL